MTTVALNEHAALGETIEYMGRTFRLKSEITREEYIRDLRAKREHDRQRGLPCARAGVYHPETKQYEPMREPPEEYKYCYEIEPVQATGADLTGTSEA